MHVAAHDDAPAHLEVKTMPPGQLERFGIVRIINDAGEMVDTTGGQLAAERRAGSSFGSASANSNAELDPMAAWARKSNNEVQADQERRLKRKRAVERRKRGRRWG